MRSQFASLHSEPKSSEFKADLKETIGLDLAICNEIAQIARKASLANTGSERKAVMSNLAILSKNLKIALSGPFGIISFFYKTFSSDPGIDPSATDSPEDIVSDFADLEIIPTDTDSSKFLHLLTALKQFAIQDKPKRLTEKFLKGMFPTLNSIGTTVELRAILDPPYDPSLPVSDYTPNVSKLIAIASINLKLDNHPHSPFFFQATVPEIQQIIDRLQATIREMTTLDERHAK